MLLKNAHIVSADQLSFVEEDIRIREGSCTERGKNLEARVDEAIVDLSGKVVLPGRVCAHTHLYSSLARGMPAPRRAPENFAQILKYIWWKLDEALDEDAIRLSALAGALEAVKYGTTTLIDHHASPNCIAGSLDIIKRAVEDVGIRAILCYETSDRGGKKKSREGMEENERFLLGSGGHPLVRGLIGAHASFTLSDRTLRELGNLVQAHDTGIHIHVAEDSLDTRDRQGRRYDVARRLERAGVLSPKSVLAHGVHLGQRECATIEKSRAWLVHNPRSNMNNAVGHAPVGYFPERVALGTDGFPANMFEETRVGYFRCAESSHREFAHRIPEFLAAGHTLVGEIFKRPFGTLEPGSAADLVVTSYQPPTPMTKETLQAHLLFGMDGSHVESVMVEGTWVVWKREVKTVDEHVILNEARNTASRLWKKLS